MYGAQLPPKCMQRHRHSCMSEKPGCLEAVVAMAAKLHAAAVIHECSCIGEGLNIYSCSICNNVIRLLAELSATACPCCLQIDEMPMNVAELI